MKKTPGDSALYADLSYQIMQAAFEEHKTLGPGFLENNYEEAFVHELIERSILFERQKEIHVSYRRVCALAS